MTGDRADRELERFCAYAYPRLVAALTHQFGDRWLAEELTQESLVRACDRWSRVRTLESPIGWCFRVGVNLGRSRFRRRAAERRARLKRGPEQTAHFDPDVADRVAVAQALADLTDEQREVVVLRYFLGLSSREAGDVVGASANAVRVRTHRALALLRERLGSQLELEEVPDGP